MYPIIIIILHLCVSIYIPRVQLLLLSPLKYMNTISFDETHNLYVNYDRRVGLQLKLVIEGVTNPYLFSLYILFRYSRDAHRFY